ncbi:hypothetical protein KUF54_07570 [Comamonas sp. Y33R10-2]|uniref:hypothetical protein n=1 Tax=Comamonas sp. Y33R10-2 TaxID=2853257 RepID=UPI001C5C99BB|nr:hypothetical protein [Comamonas sp. Y33R10-2]QXZ11036.1 hypothetical protein KUF54_07570 [Comamonas sp. Y33R10-2]
MLFYISYKFANALSTCSDCQDVLSQLIDSRKSGTHLIYANKKSSNLILNFLSANNKRHYELFNNISKLFIEKKSLIRKLEKFIYLTDNSNNIIKSLSRILIIPASIANNSQITYPTLFLGENINDCNFYALKIAKNYKKTISPELHNLSINSRRFEGGGGSCTHVPYGRYKSNKIDLCLCIADSDRSYPSANLGNTANLILAQDKLYENQLCDFHIIDFYSAENLIPIEITLKINTEGKSQQQLDLLDEYKKIRSINEWRYLPMKKGFNCQEIRESKATSTFWKRNLSRTGVNLNCCLDEECQNVILPSVSDKTLIKSISVPGSDWEYYLNSEKNKSIMKSYEKLTNTIISWLCAGSPIRT